MSPPAARPNAPEPTAADRQAGSGFGGPAPAAPTVAAIEGGLVVLGGRAVLRGVTMAVREGEVIALLGANGSGKSTMVRALIGLVPLAAGEVRLFGTPLGRFRDWQKLGYVPQRTTAAAGVPATAREVVASGRLAHKGVVGRLGRRDRAAVDAALGTVGLSDRANESVARLSGGQQQRVLIARALAAEPDLLILDEPMAGVDQASQRALAATLTGLRSNGTTILLVLHELGPLGSLIERAVALREGSVVHDGAPPAAVGHHADPAHDHVHPHAPEETGWLR